MDPSTSKVEAVIRNVLARVQSGALHQGARLRSIREEASVQAVSRNTVVEAYLRLVAQGVVQARPGSGYYVTRPTPQPAKGPLMPFAGIADGRALLTEQLEMRLPVRPGDGRLPSDWLEESKLRGTLSFMRLLSTEAYNYNSAWGFLPLRERLCSALVERGIECQPGQMLMTNGANHAMDLIIRSYVRPGDAVLVDDPGYYPLFSKLNVAGARIVGVQRRAEGPDLQDLERQAHASGARLFFTQSLAHSPTGGSLTAGVAYGVLRVATAHNLVIVEDDPFADILPDAVPRLASLDQLERVIYVGSFSKTLAGSFRVGYVAASRERAAELAELLLVTTVSTSSHNERIVFALIDQGHYLKHLRALRLRINRATDNTVRALAQIGAVASRPQGSGIYLWLNVPSALVQSATVQSAATQGIFLAPSSAFAANGNTSPAMRVNVAHGAHPAFLNWLAAELRKSN